MKKESSNQEHIRVASANAVKVPKRAPSPKPGNMEMEGQTGGLEVDERRLKAADPDGLYLFMLEDYPYMMTPDHVAAFTGTTSQEIRRPRTSVREPAGFSVSAYSQLSRPAASMAAR